MPHEPLKSMKRAGYSLTLLPQQCGDIGEIIDNQASREKESNREVFLGSNSIFSLPGIIIKETPFKSYSSATVPEIEEFWTSIKLL